MYGLERPRTMGDVRVMFMTRSQVPQGLTVLGFRQSEQVCPTPVCNLPRGSLVQLDKTKHASNLDSISKVVFQKVNIIVLHRRHSARQV